MTVTQDLLISAASISNLRIFDRADFKNKYRHYGDTNANIYTELLLKPTTELLALNELLRAYGIEKTTDFTVSVNGLKAVNSKLIVAEKSYITSVTFNKQLKVIELVTTDRKEREQSRTILPLTEKEKAERLKEIESIKNGAKDGRIPGFRSIIY